MARFDVVYGPQPDEAVMYIEPHFCREWDDAGDATEPAKIMGIASKMPAIRLRSGTKNRRSFGARGSTRPQNITLLHNRRPG